MLTQRLTGLANRRRFLQYLAMVSVGGRALLRSRDAKAAVYAAKGSVGAETAWPDMPRRKLGRTGYDASLLVFGCGAALSRRRNDELLNAALDAGINVFDVGTRRYYRDAERNLAPFLKQVRDRIFLISKAPVYLDVEPEDAITPAGWYSWADKGILEGTKPMSDLQPLLARARESGIGLVGMKAGRYLAGRKFIGWGKPDAFDEYYGEVLKRSELSPFQRSYAFVLAHGLDAVNADMQSFAHLQQNVAAAATSATYFA